MKSRAILPLVFSGVLSSGCMENDLHSINDLDVFYEEGQDEGSGSHETTLPSLSVRDLVEACLGIDAKACPEPHADNNNPEDLARWEKCITDSELINSSMRSAFEGEMGMPIEELDEGPLPLPLTVCGYTRFVDAHYQNDDIDLNVLESDLLILPGDQIDELHPKNCDVEDESIFVLHCEAQSIAPFSEGYDADFENLRVVNSLEGHGYNSHANIYDSWALSSGEYDTLTINGSQFSPEEDDFSFGNTYSELGSNISDLHGLAEDLNGEPWIDNEKSASRFLVGGEDQ